MNNNGSLIDFELYMVRHGQSCGNIENGFGKPREELTLEEIENPHLTEFGFRQAEFLGEKLKSIKFDEVFAGPLFRSVETAYGIIRKNQVSQRRIHILPFVFETGIDLDYQGMTYDELYKIFGDKIAPAEEVDMTGKLIIPDCNDKEKIAARASVVKEYLHSRFKNGEKLLLVGHGGFNGDMLISFLGCEFAQKTAFSFDNTSVTKLIFYNKNDRDGNDVKLCYHNRIAEPEF